MLNILLHVQCFFYVFGMYTFLLPGSLLRKTSDSKESQPRRLSTRTLRDTPCGGWSMGSGNVWFCRYRLVGGFRPLGWDYLEWNAFISDKKKLIEKSISSLSFVSSLTLFFDWKISLYLFCQKEILSWNFFALESTFVFCARCLWKFYFSGDPPIKFKTVSSGNS